MIPLAPSSYMGGLRVEMIHLPGWIPPVPPPRVAVNDTSRLRRVFESLKQNTKAARSRRKHTSQMCAKPTMHRGFSTPLHHPFQP